MGTCTAGVYTPRPNRSILHSPASYTDNNDNKQNKHHIVITTPKQPPKTRRHHPSNRMTWQFRATLTLTLTLTLLYTETATTTQPIQPPPRWHHHRHRPPKNIGDGTTTGATNWPTTTPEGYNQPTSGPFVEARNMLRDEEDAATSNDTFSWTAFARNQANALLSASKGLRLVSG